MTARTVPQNADIYPAAPGADLGVLSWYHETQVGRADISGEVSIGAVPRVGTAHDGVFDANRAFCFLERVSLIE